MILKKIKLAAIHFFPSAIGFPKLFIRHPLFSLRLLFLRFIYFSTNRLLCELKDPYGFSINNYHMLISYWLFFVENDLSTKQWVSKFKQADKPIAIDVGANGGVFSHMLMTMNPGVRVYAYEPLPAMSECIRNNQLNTGANITLYSAACGDSCGTSSLYFSDAGDTNASLLIEGREEKDKVTVETVTLDTTIPDEDVFIVKVDTQGYELNVLKGGSKTIAKAKFLILEFHSQGELEEATEHLGPDWKYTQISPSDYLFHR